MSDKSFGDHGNRNVVKNPLLSTSVVGLSLQDLTSNAVLLPVAQSPALVASQDRQSGHAATPPHRQSGDSNQNTNTTHKPAHHIPQPNPADDFDVSEYFARLQGTRYVSAPVNINAELEKTTLAQAEENLEEINLNELPVQQSITSDIAHNFSQLPQVLPQVASAVFSSFSNMLSYKSREVTPEVEAKTADPGFSEVQFASPAGLGAAREETESKREVAPPPKDLVGSSQNTFRIATKKKSYAQIPGLSSGEMAPLSQFSQPPHTSSAHYGARDFESGHLNPPAQMAGQLPVFNLGQMSQIPPSFGLQGSQSQSGQITHSGHIFDQSESAVPAQSSELKVQSGQPQKPPMMTQAGLYKEVDIVNIAVAGQTNVQQNVATKVPSVELAVNTSQVVDGARIPVSNSQSTVVANEPIKTTAAFNPERGVESEPKLDANILAFKPENLELMSPAQSIQMYMPSQTCSGPDVAYDTCKNQPQNSSSFSNVPELTEPKDTPIIPPPTMFSNQRRDSKTDVGRTILPPSVARRLAGKQPTNVPAFEANIFVPAPVGDPATIDSFAAASKSSTLEQTSISTGFSVPNFTPSSSNISAPPPASFSTPAATTGLVQNVPPMAPPPVNQTLASDLPSSAQMKNIFTPNQSAVNLPSSTLSETTTTTQLFDPTSFATKQHDQTVAPNTYAPNPPKPAFDLIAFTTNPPEPKKVIPEPPKVSAGNTNFRLSKKRPQYYSGPIEGVGSISNNVKPTIPQAEVSGAYQGALFSPAPVQPPEMSTLDSNQPFIPAHVPLETNTVPFDLSKVESTMGTSYEYSGDQQQHIRSQIDTAFDFSRHTTENIEQPKESKGFGLIGSLKSKLSALDINKIQNSVTTFFDPAYNEGVEIEPDNYSQIYGPNNQQIGQSGQSYVQTGTAYGQPGQSGPMYGHQDHQANLEIFIPHSQQMPEQAFNQQSYDSTFNQCQSSNMDVHGLQQNNQYFPEHYNYYQHPTADPQSYYTVQQTHPYIQPPVEKPPSTEQIQLNKAANVCNPNVYDHNQMSEGGSSKSYFDNQHLTNANQYDSMEVKHMTQQQVDDKLVTDQLLRNQTVGYQGSILKLTNKGTASDFQLDGNTPTNPQINDILPLPQTAAMANTVEENQCVEYDTKNSVTEATLKKERIGSPELSVEDEIKADDTQSNLVGQSSPENVSELTDKIEDLNLNQPSRLNLDDNNVNFFDNIDRIQEPSEDKSVEDITDLKMCETCREVNNADLSKIDLTSQLIQNITAPIQLSNPVEVPLTETETPVVENIPFVSNPCAEISNVTEETIEAILLAADKDVDKTDQRPEIPEITNYGWCDSQSIQPVDHESDLADPDIENINAIHDYTFHSDPNAVGLISNNSLFFDDILTNASDEIKTEFKNAHDEPSLFTRQMSIPSAPAEEDLDIEKFDVSGGLDVQLIEQDAKRDFPVFEEFIIEPSETDDNKVKERERSGSKDEVNEKDTFTNRLEKFKKLEDSVDPTGSNVAFKVQTTVSPNITIASYFDTGNYAAETHYRNSLTSPPSTNTMNFPAQKSNVSILPPTLPSSRGDGDFNNAFIPEVDKSRFERPDIAHTITSTTTASSEVCNYTTTTACKPSSYLPQSSFAPEQSVQETPQLTKDCVNLAQENVFQTNVKSDQGSTPLAVKSLPDPINFFAFEQSEQSNDDAITNRLASYFASPAKTSDNTKSFFELSQGQDHLKDNETKNWETTQSCENFFVEHVGEEKATQQNLAKDEYTLRQQGQSLGRAELLQGSANQHQTWESTQSFKAFFNSDDASKNEDNYKMTQIQNVMCTPEQYRTNLHIMKDLTSPSNFQPTEDQVVRTVNYNTVIYPNRTPKTNFSTGEPKPKNVDDKYPHCENLEHFYVNSDLEETPVPDDSKLEILVNKCKRCCNFNSGRVVEIKEADFDTYKTRQAMDGRGSDGKQDGSALPEKQPGAGPNNTAPLPDVLLQFEDNKEDANATLSDGRGSAEYVPVRHHWFYRVDAEGKSIWRGFSVIDNKALEEAFSSPDLNENTVVATDGGRFDVNVVGRLRVAVYWADKPTNVRRCSWFYKGTTDARYVPYTEAVAEKLEEEYRRGISTGEWHRRLVLPNNEAVVMHGPAVMVHFLQSSAADAWSGGTFFQLGKSVYRNPPKIRVAKDQVAKIDHLVLIVHGAGEWRNQKAKLQSTMRPRVVRRGYDESEIEDPEPSSIDHLLLLCHGVGSACDMRFRSVEEVVDDFRATSLQLIQGHYKSSYDDGIVGRVEVLPISWHSTLHSGEGGVDRRLARITLDSIPRLRSFTNDTVLDVLFYTSPVFCQTILDEVCKELNRIYTLFKQRNPSFEGGVSLGGHSLGSVILYDLLCHQEPKDPATSSTNLAEKVVTGSAGTGQPTVRYPVLRFTPQAMYALGSPIAIFECIRGVDCLGEHFALPNCQNFFNIFHPYDPIAYRIEPLINPQLKNVSPFLIPHHKGRKRMHLELKETVARVGADLKQKLVESLRSTWSLMWRAPPPAPAALQQVLEEQLEREPLEPAREGDAVPPPQLEVDALLGKLNAGRRVDYVLQEAPFEMINEYLFAMSSHVCYWESEDTMLLMLREIYDALGVQPDCCLPQQTMAVQRTRAPSKTEDILANAEAASTSGGLEKS